MPALVNVAHGTWLDADEVVAVTGEGQFAVVHLSSGARLTVALNPAQVAQRLNQFRGEQQQQQQAAASVFSGFGAR